MKTLVPEFVSGVGCPDVRAVQCCVTPRRRSHFARILEIFAISKRTNSTIPTWFASLTKLNCSHFRNRSQLTPYQRNIVQVLLDALPPCSHGGPIEARAVGGVKVAP